MDPASDREAAENARARLVDGSARRRISHKITGPAKFAVAMLITAIASAYAGYAVPRWLEGEKALRYERGFTNKSLPPNLRYSAEGTKFPYLYSSEIRLENVGDVVLQNEDVSVTLAPSSMDCGILKPSDRRVKAFEASGNKQFDADFDNFIANEDHQQLTIHLANLEVGQHKTFVLFSNFAFRTVLKPVDEKLTIETVVPRRPDKSFEDDPWKLTNCEDMLNEFARRKRLAPYKSMDSSK